MKPIEFYRNVIVPGFALLPPKFDSPEARLLLLAIGGVESNWSERRQMGGPARGFFECEDKHAGVEAVLQSSVTTAQIILACDALNIPFDEATIFEAIAWNDALCCVIARMILWLDPLPLPALDDCVGAVACYLRNWRPGKPDRARWDAVYAWSLACFASLPVAEK